MVLPTRLDLSKVTSLVEENVHDHDGGEETPQTSSEMAKSSGLMPFRRSLSDLEAMAHASTAALKWTSQARRQRRSLGDVGEQVRALESPRRVPPQSRAEMDALREKRYAEMMERFQIRRVVATAALHSVRSCRGVSTARSTKVHPGLSDEPNLSSVSEVSKSPGSKDVAGQSRTLSVSSVSQTNPHHHISEERSFGEILGQDDPPRRPFEWLLNLRRNLRQPIHPSSNLSRVRCVVLLIGFAFHAIYFPLEAAYFSGHQPPGALALDKAFEMLLLVDCVLTFNSAYYNRRGELVMSRPAIARHYARTWLAPDLLSSIPIEWVLRATNAYNVWLHVVADGFLRLGRVFHVVEVSRVAWVRPLYETDCCILTWLFYSRYSHLVRILSIIFCIVLGAHYLACILKLLSDDPTSAGGFTEYVSNLYNALQLLQGQGVSTTSIGESIFAAVSLLVGSIALAIVFGHVAILVSNFNANSTSYQRKMESVFAVMGKLQLPIPLRERIHQYYEHLWREYESLDGEIVAFSKGLSHTLELEVVLFKYMDLIMHVPFWRDGSPDFQKQLMLSLRVRVYLPDDFIIRRGEVGDEFFMINRGLCELVSGSDSIECATDALDDEEVGSVTSRKDAFVKKPLTSRHVLNGIYSIHTLRRGQSFGELALLMNYERTADVRALTYVEMCVLKRPQIQAIFVKHPKDRRIVIKSMLTRTMENNADTTIACSLRLQVEAVFATHDGTATVDPRTTQISPAHAALLIANAIDVEKDDGSHTYGIGATLREKLMELRMKEEKNKDRASAYNTSPTQVTSFESHERLVGRLEHLRSAQRQLLTAMEDLRQDHRAARLSHHLSPEQGSENK